MRIWKEQVMERDDFTCQRCGNKKSATTRVVGRIETDGKVTSGSGTAACDISLMKEKLGSRFNRYYRIEDGMLIRTYKSTRLHVHHIKELAYLLQKYSVKTLSRALKCDTLWDLDNGLTLCRDCHYHEDFGRKKKKTKRVARVCPSSFPSFSASNSP